MSPALSRLIRQVRLYVLGFLPATLITGVVEALVRDGAARGMKVAFVDTAAGWTIMVAPVLLLAGSIAVVFIFALSHSLVHRGPPLVAVVACAIATPIALVVLGTAFGGAVPAWFGTFPVSSIACSAAYGALAARIVVSTSRVGSRSAAVADSAS